MVGLLVTITNDSKDRKMVPPMRLSQLGYIAHRLLPVASLEIALQFEVWRQSCWHAVKDRKRCSVITKPAHRLGPTLCQSTAAESSANKRLQSKMDTKKSIFPCAISVAASCSYCSGRKRGRRPLLNLYTSTSGTASGQPYKGYSCSLVEA